MSPRATPGRNSCVTGKATGKSRVPAIKVCDTQALVKKTIKAAQHTGHQTIALSGGVACNQALQSQLIKAAAHAGLKVQLTPPALTTDNAAVIAFAALLASENRPPDPLNLGINPNLSLGQ